MTFTLQRRVGQASVSSRRPTIELRKWWAGARKLACPTLRLRLSVSLSLLLLLQTGCASFELPTFNLEKYIPMMTGRTGEFRRPLKVVAFWTDTVRTADGQPPMRGFGGRLMFYDGKRGKPLKVAGTLVVYGFDEEHKDPDNPRPDRKFVFTPEQFAKHYSKSDLGPSYSFWIPWDNVGGETKEIGLICRFTPVEGGAIVSEQVRQILPGVQPLAGADTGATTAVSTPVKLVHYEMSAEEAARRRMATTTIDLNGPPDRRLPTALARPRPSVGQQGIDRSMPITPAAASSPAAPGQSPANPSAAPTGQTGAMIDRAASSPAPASWLARFGAHQSRVPGAPIVPPDRGRGPWRPTHVVPPSAQPTSPTPNQASAVAPSAAVSPQ